MKKDGTRINKENNNTKKVIIGILVIISIMLLLVLILELNGINIVSGQITKNRKAMTKAKSIAEYEIVGTDTTTNEVETLVTIENEKGIETIQIEDVEIYANGREKLSFDRKLLENSETNIKIKLIDGEEENLLLVPTVEPTGIMRVTETKKEDADWKSKIELSVVDTNTPTYYSIDEGENWTLLSKEIILQDIEIEKVKVNKLNNNIWEVKKKNNIKQTGYDTITQVLEEIIDTSGYYKTMVQNEQIAIHAYVQNENLIISETTEYGDADDVGTAAANGYAKNMVVLKVNGNITVSQNAKLTAYGTQYGGPKGLYIYVTGKLENNGEISMTARGAKAVGQNLYLYTNQDGTYEYIPKLGSAGATRKYAENGTNGTGRGTGGGGAGGGMKGTPGAGGQGTSYSGGPGGGGVHQGGASAGAANGGAGGDASGYENSTNWGFKAGRRCWESRRTFKN